MRKIISFNDNWVFYGKEGEESVTLPHTWNREDGLRAEAVPGEAVPGAAAPPAVAAQEGNGRALRAHL